MDIALLLIQLATLVALIVYVVKTWHMATATREAAESSAGALREMQATREAESRPYVAVFVEPDEVEPRAIDIVVHNYGKTAAHNINMRFDPQLQSSWPEVIENVAFLTEGIAFLPPGARLQTTYDVVAKEGQPEVPRVYTVTLEYMDEGGVHRYRQVERLDAAQHRGVGTVQDSDRQKALKAAEDSARAISAMDRNLKHIADRLDKGVPSGLPAGVLPSLREALTVTQSFCDMYLSQDSDGTAYLLGTEIKDALRQQRRLVLATWFTVEDHGPVEEPIRRLVTALTEVVEHEFDMDGEQSLTRLRVAVRQVRELCADLRTRFGDHPL